MARRPTIFCTNRRAPKYLTAAETALLEPIVAKEKAAHAIIGCIGPPADLCVLPQVVIRSQGS